MDRPLLIACSDLHLSETAPVFRSAEPDWYAAQARQLEWLCEKVTEYQCPLVIAGDVFDKAIGTTRLVNFVADQFLFSQPVYAIAGNHDLPYHNLERMAVSSYGSLIRTKSIRNIGGPDENICYNINNTSVAVHGFPFGVKFKPCQKRADIDIAVVHHFIWSGHSPLSGIIADSHIDILKTQLPGYDFYVFGDNHQHFIDGNLVNCGSFYRRTKGDETKQPVITLIYPDRLVAEPVPVFDDIMTITAKAASKKTGYDFSGFFQSLRQADTLTCDVEQILHDYLHTHRIEQDVQEAIISITESPQTKT